MSYPRPPHPATQPQPDSRPRSRAYRVWAHILIWVPVVIGLLAALGGTLLLFYADADPQQNGAYGYLGVVVWVMLLVASPFLLAALIGGIVMLMRR